MFSKINSMGIFGMEAFMVEVEADITSGQFRFDIVGLPDTAVAEARERVRAAIKNNKLDFPYLHITINLAPADIRKEGPIYDLPILIAILKAAKQLDGDFKDCAFIGELSLGGDIKHINGVLPMVMAARDRGVKNIYIPYENAAEASVVNGVNIFAVENIRSLFAH